MGRMMIDENLTIREVARRTNLSKSTVHVYLNLLKKYYHSLYRDVRDVLDYNTEMRVYRGGESTRRKFEKQRVG